MVGAISKTLAERGHDVSVVTPLYRGVLRRYPRTRPYGLRFDIELGDSIERAEVFSLELNHNSRILFVAHDGFFDRNGLYQDAEQGTDYPDNAQRYLFFSKCVVEICGKLPNKPDVVHLHDWQTGFVPLFLMAKYAGNNRPGTVMTIHNLAYQGNFAPDTMPFLNLPYRFFNPEGIEFYGNISFLKTGLVYADLITTVSPTYAREITTPEFGCSLDGVLRKRRQSLTGILNGVDYSEWNTTHNPVLPQAFNFKNLQGKKQAKLKMQRELGMAESANTPVFGNIGRLAYQKGIDILLRVLPDFLEQDFQFVCLGAGSHEIEKALTELKTRFPRQIGILFGFYPDMAHLIEAGCDFYIMPSRYEPCGLNQMFSLRYGTIPIVHAVGGLEDSVVDYRESLVRANGIKFRAYSAETLAVAIREALELYGSPYLMRYFQRNAMTADFSWHAAAAEYEKVYVRCIELLKSGT